MISVDTNVLLRIYANDNPEQKRTVLSLLGSSPAGHVRVSVVVLAEIAWALRSVYKLPKPAMVEVFLDLLSREELYIEHRAAVFSALTSFGRFRIDFGDCLIAALNEDAGASPTYTFDLKASALNAFASLGEKGGA